MHKILFEVTKNIFKKVFIRRKISKLWHVPHMALIRIEDLYSGIYSTYVRTKWFVTLIEKKNWLKAHKFPLWKYIIFRFEKTPLFNWKIYVFWLKSHIFLVEMTYLFSWNDTSFSSKVISFHIKEHIFSVEMTHYFYWNNISFHMKYHDISNLSLIL